VPREADEEGAVKVPKSAGQKSANQRHDILRLHGGEASKWTIIVHRRRVAATPSPSRWLRVKPGEEPDNQSESSAKAAGAGDGGYGEQGEGQQRTPGEGS
jgi:hypothetical protein